MVEYENICRSCIYRKVKTDFYCKMCFFNQEYIEDRYPDESMIDEIMNPLGFNKEDFI